MTRAAAGPARIVAYGLAAINIVGILGLVWVMVPVLFFDGFMVIEFSIWAAAIAALSVLTVGGLLCLRHGPLWAALVLLAVGAIPTTMVVGGLLYLEANPIDWK